MNQILQVESGPRRLSTTVQALWLCMLVMLLGSVSSHAATGITAYTLPAALTASPFNCTLRNGTYECGSIDLDKDTDLNLTADVNIWVKNGSFTAQKNLTTVNNGHALSLAVDLDVSMKKDTDIDMTLVASGSISFAKNARIDGNITSSVDVTFAKDSTVNGNLIVSRDLTGAKNVVVNGYCQVGRNKSNVICTGGTVALHHVRVTYSPSTTACGGTAVTIAACTSADSNGSCTAYTGGISGTLVAETQDGTQELATMAFSIASGSSTTTGTLPTISSPQTAELTFRNISKTTSAAGTCWSGSTNDCQLEVTSCGMHHVRLNHGGTGVTCVPAAVTVNACSGADSNGTCTASTAGISGTVLAKTAAGATLASVNFAIPSGQSSQTISVPVTTEQTATFSTASLSSTPTNGTTCWNGSSTSCDYKYWDSGFVFDIPNHLGGTAQTVPFKAVKKADNSNACQPTLPDGTYAVNFSCNYADPATGTNSVTISSGSGASLSSKVLACAPSSGTATSSAVNVAFVSGVGAISATYPDAGKVLVNANYTGSNTGTISGTDTFISAPTKFVIGSTTTALQADVGFTATATAVNASGATMPNFGQEHNQHRAALTFTKCGGASTGTFSGGLNTNGVGYTGNFLNGVGTASGLMYSEVGTLDATAALATNGNVTPSTYMEPDTSYAVAGATTSGNSCTGGFASSTGNTTVGPAYLLTELNPTSTEFAYSGVPFTLRITAKNGSGVTTKNYTSGAYARNATLSAVTATGGAVAATVGTLSSTTVNSSAFTSSNKGYADATPTFTFPSVTGGVNGAKLAPQTIYLRAVEASPGTATSALSGSNPSPYEARLEVRYGRLRLFNAYGSSVATLSMPVQAEYWNGSAWVINGDDSTTKIQYGAIGFPTGGTITTASRPASDVQLAYGKGTIRVSPGSTSKGWTYVALHLGSLLTTYKNCLTGSTIPSISGANLTGLRSYQGCGAGTYDYDPTARAYFGVQSQETKGVVHVREVFN